MTPTDIDVKRLLPEGKHLIGGEFVPARSGETFDIIDPATQETLLAVPRGTKMLHRPFISTCMNPVATALSCTQAAT